jgi:hypothetical protein
MITTGNLGLTVWDSEEDDFEHSQLADNFVRIDAHSHAGGLSEALNAHDELEGNGHWTNLGLGLAIRTAAIEPEAIWRYLLKLRSVASKQIDIEGVLSENIAEHNVLNKHLANESVNDRTIAEETITIDKLDPNILTLGSVILWFKYSSGATPGDLWHLMDGTAWASIPNNLGLSSGNIPDLRERFVRGTDINHTGEVGGNASVDLAHSHNVSSASLQHTHTVGSHNHSITVDGKHRHGFSSGGGGPHQLFQRITKYEEVSGKQELQSLWDTFSNSEGELEVPMQETGEHSHGGNTGLNPAFASGGSSLSGSVSTDVKLANINTTPPFVGLVYIMRVL